MSTRERRPGLREPIVIDAAATKRDEELRAEVHDYRGHVYFDCRKFYRVGDDWKHGRGLTVRASMLPRLRVMIEAAVREALRLQLLDEESFQSAGLELPAEMGGAP